MNVDVDKLPEVVDEVLQYIHHLGRHVVEGDGEVTHPTKALVLEVVVGVLVMVSMVPMLPPCSTCTAGTSPGSNLGFLFT